MALQQLDWILLALFFVILLFIGFFTGRKAGKDATSFFLSSRNMPWWLLGISMVATTFSLGTPNLVSDIVRTDGISGNWVWWAFLLTSMLTAFVYAKLWNRSKVMTDMEFYEIRYSGRIAAFLRVFRAIYLGFFFNIFVLASASLAFIKLASVMLGVQPTPALIIASLIVLSYSTFGGLRSIIWTDLFQFIFALFGAIAAAFYVVRAPEIDGLSNLFTHPNVSDKLNLIPDISDPQTFLGIFLIPLTIQWWAAWYPGSEPGGGGYIAQRLLSAKSEIHAIGATLIFNFFHYAIRPWPWIIVGLGSLIVFPDIQSIRASFPDIPTQYIQNDIAYPAMLREFLPGGILGLVVASLIAAYMSTVSTQLNWGASYMVNDVYVRFINPKATEKQKVRFGRFSTILLMLLSVSIALLLENALQVFQYVLMIGAGTGLIYILRWFWWRINAWSELTAMIAATIFSILFILIENLGLQELGGGDVLVLGHQISLAYWNIIKFTGIVFLTSVSWLTVTLLTKPADESKLRTFYKKIRPGGAGWKTIINRAQAEGIELEKEKKQKWDVPTEILCMSLGSASIYSLLFAIGNFLYGNNTYAIAFIFVAIISTFFVIKLYRDLI